MCWIPGYPGLYPDSQNRQFYQKRPKSLTILVSFGHFMKTGLSPPSSETGLSAPNSETSLSHPMAELGMVHPWAELGMVHLLAELGCMYTIWRSWLYVHHMAELGMVHREACWVWYTGKHAG